MTGLPAARQSDMTLHGGPITQGSLTVNIGTAGGVACSVCPGGVAEGNPVNPVLGAKVVTPETDLALPDPLPFVVSREYSSYQTDSPAPVGLLGPGWWLSVEASLMQSDGLLQFNDSKGRSIRFESLQPGQSAYSRSESLWIVRGGADRLDKPTNNLAARLSIAWQGLHAEDRGNPSMFFATNDPLGPWWIFGSREQRTDINGLRLHLLGLNDRFGNTQRIRRDPAQNGWLVQDASGRQYRLETQSLCAASPAGTHGWGEDPGVRLIAVYLTHDPHSAEPPPALPLVRYEYSARGELASVYGRSGLLQRSFQYHPQLPGRLVSHAFAGRPAVTYVYNREGKVVEQHRPGALSYRFDYSVDSTTVTDSLERTRIYRFKGQQGLKRVVQLQHADGSVTASQYDSNGRLTSSVDALGRETSYELDTVTGDLRSVTDPDGQKTQWEYNAHGQIVSVRGSAGASEHFEYDTLGRPSATTDALGHTTRFHYADERSEQPHAIEDAKGGKVRLAWTPTQQQASVTDCSASVTRYRYNRWGQLVQQQGEEGSGFSNEFDLVGRLVARIDALGQATRYAYSAAGDLMGITGPDGKSTRVERDASGRMIARHQGGLTQRYEYNAAGRLTAFTNENGARATFAYDVMDRIVSQLNIDGRQQTYRFNAAGELIESVDAGLVSRFRYDAGGRLLERHTGNDASAQQRQRFIYDAAGQLQQALHHTEIGGNGISVQFERDLLGRVVRETQSIEDAQGNPVWKFSAAHAFNEIGVEKQTDYDGLSSIQWLTYGSGHLHGVALGHRTVVDFERDRLHREVKRKLGPFQASRSYDRLSRLSQIDAHSPLIGEEEKDASLNRAYRYDLASQLVQMETAAGPHLYDYDEAGRLVKASQPALPTQHYRFDPAGNRLFADAAHTRQAQDWDETVHAHFNDPSFNLLGEVAAASNHQGEAKWMKNQILDDGDFQYEYDQWGNLRRKHSAQRKEEHLFQYDLRHRLIRYTLESEDAIRGANYHYDALGRRLIKQVQNADAQGQLLGDVQTFFSGWDADRHVLSEKDGHAIFTVYQPNGYTPVLRVEGRKQASPTTLASLLAAQQNTAPLAAGDLAALNQIEAQIRSGTTSAPTAQWLQRMNIPQDDLRQMLASPPRQASEDAQQTHIFHCDHQGTPIALISETGEISNSVRKDPWGNVLKNSTADSQVLGIAFPGQQVDPESGLHYNRHRYYDPQLGRYINQDPIGFDGSDNFYAYPGNPVQQIDPLGLTVTVIASNKADTKKLQDAYAKLKKSKRGREICKILEDSKTKYYIRAKKDEWIYCSEAAAEKHKDTCTSGGNTVYIDPDKGPKIYESTGMQPPALEIILGHELGHAVGAHDDGVGKMDNVNRNENPIRAELGYPPRIAYNDPYDLPPEIVPYQKSK